ncbi:MAG: hypothetical protein K6G61_11695 [Solobacterium sp.]|nr:hypothetical protein [Solobacterium sp.]
MNEMTLLKAIGDINDIYVEEALPASLKTKEKRSVWLDLRLLAPAFCLILAAVLFLPPLMNDQRVPAGPDVLTGGPGDTAGTAGFELHAPDTYQNSEEPVYSVIAGTIVEASYHAGDKEVLNIRKAAGSDDISGDYSEYENETVLILDQLDITCRGNGGSWNLLLWTKDGYTYAVGIPDGIRTEDIAELVSSID